MHFKIHFLINNLLFDLKITSYSKLFMKMLERLRNTGKIHYSLKLSEKLYRLSLVS